jgi:SOS-response transcriptional repressor LexA
MGDTGVPELGQRLKTIRVLLKMNQSEFARSVGDCSQAFISDVERGARMPSASILAGLEHFGYSGRWVLTGEGSITLRGGTELPPRPAIHHRPKMSGRSEMTDSSDSLYVADAPAASLRPLVYGLRNLQLVGKVAAGLDRCIPDDEVERLLPVYLGDHADCECFASRVTGRSMEPAFRAGDIIVIDKTCPPADNDIAVVVVDDQVMLKRVSMDDSTVYLLSINTAVPPIRVSRSNPAARIVGKVIQLIRDRF